jgi:hypothetical protein
VPVRKIFAGEKMEIRFDLGLQWVYAAGKIRLASPAAALARVSPAQICPAWLKYFS